MAKLLEKLSDNYIKLFENEKDFNVIIEVGKSPNVKEFRTHTVILKCRSIYFHDKLENATKDSNNIIKISLKPNISIQQFEIIVRYIYGGVITLENLDESFIFNLLLVSCELLLEDLTQYLETDLIESKSHWLRLHFAKVYKSSFQNDKLLKLQDWCTNTLSKYPDHIFNSEDFLSLQENALISLIKRDDLQAEETKIWNRVIEWGIAQNSDLSPETKDWTQENFKTLKTILKNCLPHIRYFQIPGGDIMNNVSPYKDILEKNLWDDIIRKFIAPDQQIFSIVLPPRINLKQNLPIRSTEPFSKIITLEHAAEIASWIDKNDIHYNSTNNPYEFKLLLRGSEDGFTNDSFWNLCDKKTNTIIVMKVKDTDEILGGYNPIAWDKSINGWSRCNESFIFSLKNRYILNSILSRVKKPEYAIHNSFRHGPHFGSGGDLGFNSNQKLVNKYYSSPLAYEKQIRNVKSDNFSADEYEVFQIKK